MRRVRKFGNAFVLQVVTEGKFMGLAQAELDGHEIVDLYADNVALSKRYRDDDAMVKLFKAYDMEIINLAKQGTGRRKNRRHAQRQAVRRREDV